MSSISRWVGSRGRSARVARSARLERRMASPRLPAALLSALLSILPPALLPAPAGAQAAPPASPETACPAVEPAGGSPPPALAHVRYLAAEALEGRSVGSQGERCTTAYLAMRFAELGLPPARTTFSHSTEQGLDWYYQRFPIRGGSELSGPARLEISGQAIEPGKAWTPYGFSGSGDAQGRLVYLGPGVPVPGQPDDAHLQVDVRGAIAVVEAVWPGVTGLRADPHLKATAAQERGAAGLIVLLPDGRPLPDVDSETRPLVRIPVAAVSGEEAESVRQAALAGAGARLAAEVQPRMVEGRNVAALLPGADPMLRGEVVVVGAHHDHLGWGGDGSLAPGTRAIHHGADDNASGAAALLQIARLLLDGPPPARSVLFLAFGGEERGLLGSSYYVENPLQPLGRTVAMLNLDMVGRLEDGPLTVFGVGTATEWEALIGAANAEEPRPLALTLLPDGFGPSDHTAFYGKGVPVLHFFTGTHADYHRPTDVWERVDSAGLERVAALAAAVTTRLTGTAERVAAALTPVAGAGAPHGGGAPGDAPAVSGYGAYFGSIPDMTPLDFGVRLTGVREDSPAARAGLREGDVLVSFGGRETADLYAFTYALQAHEPGDRVEVVVLRDGERITTVAVLTERP